jgi:predicted Zn-dependent protease
MKRLAISGSVLIILFMLDSCAKNPVTGKTEFMLMSKEQEIAMGRQSDPEITAFFGLYQDEKLQRFIDQKGEAMAAISHRPDLPFEFKIVDSPVVNAFAVPGGYVYFTRGIMAHFNNEAEFAGVLGHEIGHITARHSAKQYSNAMLGQLGLVAGTLISPEFAQFADIAQQGLQLLFLKFGRDAESQSDKLGVEYSTKIGYDAAEMADFFSTLGRLSTRAGGEEVPTFLSTHPDPADREEKVVKHAAAWKRKAKDPSLEVGRDSYLRMIDGLVYGEDPKQGFVENNAFYHPVLRFQFSIPSGWAVQNTPQQVQMAPQGGRAVMMLRLAQGNSLEAAAQTVLKNLQLTVVDSRQESVNGLPALVVIADQTPQQQQQQSAQQRVRALMYFIQYGENIYNMIGASSQTDFNAYAQLFQSAMRTFGPLTDPSKINRQAERVRIKTVPQSGTLSQALTSLGVNQQRMEELAVLNGMTINDQVQRGMLIKVIE